MNYLWIKTNDPTKILDELISLAHNELQNRPDADMSFIDSVAEQYREKGSLSPKQIQALENIAVRELKRRQELTMIVPMFNL